jgi:hypothetical protein
MDSGRLSQENLQVYLSGDGPMRSPMMASYDICKSRPFTRPTQVILLTDTRHLFNRERLLLTSPKALAEVLTTNSYDFVKPQLLREGIGQVLGIGILFAEGDEHKVSLSRSKK